MALISGLLPFQTCYGTPQQMLDLFAQYLSSPTQNVVLDGELTTNFGGLPASPGNSRTSTLSVAGAGIGDPVVVGLPANPPSGVVYDGFCAGANTVTVRANFISAQTPTTQTFKIKVLKVS